MKNLVNFIQKNKIVKRFAYILLNILILYFVFSAKEYDLEINEDTSDFIVPNELKASQISLDELDEDDWDYPVEIPHDIQK